MRFKLFPYVIALAALAVSASAASYSVYGLSKLFAGASSAVIVMAASLEFAKLVVASVLYQYWTNLNVYIRTYLFAAVFVLIIITSGGIYGFLSGAYQDTADKSELMSKHLDILQTKQHRYIDRLDDVEFTIKETTSALANPTKIQYVDSESGQLVTTTSSRQRRSLESRLVDAKLELKSISDSISVYDVRIIELQSGNDVARELGPLKYMAGLLNKPMESIINWFMILIIFVFDPLAIVLVVVANMAFMKSKPEITSEIENIKEPIIIKPVAKNHTDDILSEVLDVLSQQHVSIYGPTEISKIQKLKEQLHGKEKQ
jgi:hypothetical protein